MLHRVRGGMVFLRLDDFDPIGLMQLLHASSRLVFFLAKKNIQFLLSKQKLGNIKKLENKKIYTWAVAACVVF